MSLKLSLNAQASAPRPPSSLLRHARTLAGISLLLLVCACASTKVGPGQYRVQSGDTLTSIARKNGQTVSGLMRMNGLTNANRIEVGQILRVNAQGASAASGGSAGAAATGASPSAAPRPTAPRVPTAPSIALAWPAAGKVVRNFNGSSAKGIDIANTVGTPVTAAAPGTVAYVGDALRGYGNLVILRHSGNYMTIYAHNRKLLVKEGQKVSQGEKISEMGTQSNGRAALYFEVRAGSTPTDPMRFLPAR